MWLAWRNSVDIYLARGFAAIASRNHGVKLVSLPATVPLSRLLDEITQYLPQQARLRLVLSANIARPCSLALPEGLKSAREEAQFVSAKITQSWGEALADLSLSIDQNRLGIAGVLSQETLLQLQKWASGKACKIASLEPAWAMASQLKIMAEANVPGFVLQEPDGLTLVSAPGRIKGLAPDNACRRITDVALGDWKNAAFLAACEMTQLNTCVVLGFEPTPLHRETDKAFTGARWQFAWSRL